MKKSTKIFLILIILGAIVRLYLLGEIPLGFFRDEAALGYNAFSIWETGKDEYGVFMPLVFRSFEVFFLPLYVYLSAPIVGLLGLSEFSTRLLSSLSGIGTLVIGFYIARRIWNEKAGLFAAFVLAIAPWHIFYSRGTFEGNLALFLFSLGFLFWIRFIDTKKLKEVFLSGLFFAFSMYAYQAERAVVPLFALIAVSLSYKKLWSQRKKLIPIIAAFLIVLIPLLSLTFKPGGYHRAFGVSVFSKDENPPGFLEERGEGLLVNNRVYLRARQVTSLYLSYFSPRNLFIEGDYDKQRSVENYSVFYAWMMPFLLLGLFRAFKKKGKKELLLFSWLFLGPVPAAMTGDPFHTYRSLLVYLPYSLFIGYGLAEVYDILKKYRKVFLLSLGGVSLASFVLFAFDYAVITQATRARAWDYGYRQIVEDVGDIKDSPVVTYDKWTEPYIHYLFFGKVDPEKYHKEVYEQGLPDDYYYKTAEEVRPGELENFEFREVAWREERGDSGTYFVMYEEALPESEFATDPKVELISEVIYPDGEVGYRIVRIRE